jgi:hypothetical protein
MSIIKKQLLRVFLTLVATIAATSNDGDIVVTLCACPESACPGNCNVFPMSECQPFYQCFMEANGIFGFVLPKLASDGDVIVQVYNDENCENRRFDSASSSGFKGSCTSECWSDISKIGAQGCAMLEDDTSDARKRISTNSRILGSVVVVIFATLLALPYYL